MSAPELDPGGLAEMPAAPTLPEEDEADPDKTAVASSAGAVDADQASVATSGKE